MRSSDRQRFTCKDRLVKAARAVDFAEKMLTETLQRELPLGSRIGVRLGRANVKGEVTAYGTGRFSNEVHFNNEVTGKPRRFTVDYDDWYLLRKGPSMVTEVA